MNSSSLYALVPQTQERVEDLRRKIRSVENHIRRLRDEHEATPATLAPYRQELANLYNQSAKLHGITYPYADPSKSSKASSSYLRDIQESLKDVDVRHPTSPGATISHDEGMGATTNVRSQPHTDVTSLDFQNWVNDLHRHLSSLFSENLMGSTPVDSMSGVQARAEVARERRNNKAIGYHNPPNLFSNYVTGKVMTPFEIRFGGL